MNGVPTNYALDLNAGLTQVLADGTYSYTYGVGRISQQQGTTTEYFLGDALGSVRQLTDQTSSIALAKTYDPYGNVISSIGNGSSAFAYTGEQLDASGLTYLRARYYNSYLNQFIQPDTIVPDPRIPADWNKYTYVRDNPVNFIDPSGHIAEKESKRAEVILERLSSIYNIRIEKDWGYPNEFASLYYVDRRFIDSCVWWPGNWRDLHELELTLDAVKAMAHQLGGPSLFRVAMRSRPVRIIRIETRTIFGLGGLSLDNVILPNWPFDGSHSDPAKADVQAKRTIVHELAHVWDTRQGFQLGVNMMHITKSFRVVCSRGVCDEIYDPANAIESALAVNKKYAETNEREDWAVSFEYFMYPGADAATTLGPIRRNYIETVIKNLRIP